MLGLVISGLQCNSKMYITVVNLEVGVKRNYSFTTIASIRSGSKSRFATLQTAVDTAVTRNGKPIIFFFFYVDYDVYEVSTV